MEKKVVLRAIHRFQVSINYQTFKGRVVAFQMPSSLKDIHDLGLAPRCYGIDNHKWSFRTPDGVVTKPESEIHKELIVLIDGMGTYPLELL